MTEATSFISDWWITILTTDRHWCSLSRVLTANEHLASTYSTRGETH